MNDVIVCKSLICFCSGTPGGRVDVVERMIGYIFVDMWAFLGELGPPPSFFSSLVVVTLCCRDIVPSKGIDTLFGIIRYRT